MLMAALRRLAAREGLDGEGGVAEDQARSSAATNPRRGLARHRWRWWCSCSGPELRCDQPPGGGSRGTIENGVVVDQAQSSAATNPLGGSRGTGEDGDAVDRAQSSAATNPLGGSRGTARVRSKLGRIKIVIVASKVAWRQRWRLPESAAKLDACSGGVSPKRNSQEAACLLLLVG